MTAVLVCVCVCVCASESRVYTWREDLVNLCLQLGGM